MTFTTPLTIGAYLGLDAGTTDITSYVRLASGISLARGRADEAGQSDPSTCNLVLDNRTGRFSPRNPSGAYYGDLRRNTPLYVTCGEGSVFLALDSTGYINTTDKAALSITGDFEARIDIELPDWIGHDLAGKYGSAGDRSWAWWIDTSGYMVLRTSADGTTLIDHTSTETVPYPPSGRRSLRVTIDVNNGAAGHDVAFYWSYETGTTGSWVQLGDTVTTAGTTSIFDSTTSLRAGRAGSSAIMTPTISGGRLREFALYSGIAGSLVANPITSAATAGASSYADAQANTWTKQASATYSKTRTTFYGEVSAWPVKWHSTGNDVWTSVEAAGIMRRLGQGAAPLGSVLRRVTRAITSPTLRAYWPMEDGSGATRMASGMPEDGSLAGWPMSFPVTEPPTLAGDSTFVASDPIPTLTGSTFRGKVNVSGYVSATPGCTARMLLNVPESGDTNGGVLLRLAGSSGSRWDLTYSTGGSLTLTYYNSSGTSVGSSGAQATALDGAPALLSVYVVDASGSANWQIDTLTPGAQVATTFSGNVASAAVPTITSVTVNADSTALLQDTAVGHLSIQLGSDPITGYADALAAYRGETAGVRVRRLCSEESITVQSLGTPSDTAAMGPQLSAPLLDLLRECETTDAGILYEARDFLGLTYRSCRALYAVQDPRLTLDYSAESVIDLEPTDDDQRTRNDVTVTRTDGSSARAVLTAPDVDDPAAGLATETIGTYDESHTLSLASDTQVADHAYWRLHLGTIDETRYPSIGLDMATTALSASVALTGQALDLLIGDPVTITDPPAWLEQKDIRQIVQGVREELNPFEHHVTLACAPATAYDVGVWDDTDSRFSPSTATVQAVVTTASGFVDVTATDEGSYFSHADGDFDIEIGGEVMTVTAAAAFPGIGSAQALTVTRQVNGILKQHEVGAAIRLDRPVYWGL